MHRSVLACRTTEQDSRIVEYLGSLGYQGYLCNGAGKLTPLGAALPSHTNGLFLPRAT